MIVRKTVLTVGLMVGCVWCLALVANADNAPPVSNRPFKPVADLHSLMYGQAVHFKAMKGLLEDPSAEKRFERLTREAGVLAELANVNTHHRDKEDYRAWAAEVRDTALAFSKEAKKAAGADEAKLGKMLRQIRQTCGDCHDMYQ